MVILKYNSDIYIYNIYIYIYIIYIYIYMSLYIIIMMTWIATRLDVYILDIHRVVLLSMSSLLLYIVTIVTMIQYYLGNPGYDCIILLY